MCVNCGNNNCGGCGTPTCEKPTELKYTSQIVYDGDTINLVGINLTIECGDNLNDILAALANKINELHP